MREIVKKTVKNIEKPIQGTEIVIENSSQSEETPKKGRKSQYYKKVKPYLVEIERYVKCGVTEAQLCAYYKVSKTQWIQYKHDNSELSELLFSAKNYFKVAIINKAYEAAIGGTYEEITEVEYYELDDDGKKVVTGGKTTTTTKYNKPDVGMLQFLLLNRFPEDFARDPQTLELRKKALELAKKGKAPDQNWEGI